jgi:hypothetical protein
VRRPGGTLETWDRRTGKRTAIHDTFNCAHCGVTCVLKAGIDPTHGGSIVNPQPHWQSDGMGVCLQCNDGFMRGLLCPVCHQHQNKHGGCVNFEKKLEQLERRTRLFQLVDEDR